MGDLFTSGNRADDLLDWAGIIVGLGGVIMGLGYNAANSNDQTLQAHGEILGRIIEDYGTAIKKVVEKAYGPIHDCLSGCNTINFTRLKREYDRTLSQSFPSKQHLIDAMHDVVDKADIAIEELQPIISLRKEMMKKIEGIQPKDDDTHRRFENMKEAS